MKQFDPFTTQFQQHRFEIFEQYRRNDPVHWGVPANPAYAGTWYVFDHANTMAGLNDERIGREGERSPLIQAAVEANPDLAELWYWINNTMVFRDPPSHTRLRKVLSPYLTREAVERLAPDIEDIANTLIDGFQDNEELELMASYANILPAEVLRRLLGFSSGHEEVIQQASNDISRAIDCVITEESIAGGARGMRAMVAVISEEIAAHRKGGCSGLLASLLKHCDQDKVIDETELIGMVMLLLFAGFETSSLLIGHGVYQLLHDSEQLSLLLKEPPLARSATDEAMRIGSPGQLIGRTVLEDCELGGKQLKKGDDMMFVLASANRDLVIHDRPNQFDIRRKVSMQAGFGFGIHFCIGATLARLEARIALQTLVRRLPHLALDDKGVKWTERIAIYGPQALHLRTNTARRGERQ